MLVLALVACGDDEGEGRAPPSEQQLCALTIGESSRDDVVAALGPASSTTGGGTLTLLQYDYGSGVALRVEDVTSLMIQLDEAGIFADATVINVPFPGCWTAQLRAREEARERGN